MNKPSEPELILALKQGSRRAFDQLYELYFKRLWAYSLSYVKSREKTEEIVQDVFVRLWTIRKSIKQEVTLRSLLFILSKHCIINAYHATINAPSYEDYIGYREQLPATDTHTQLDYTDFLKQIERILQKLPLTQQRVVRLSKIEQWSNKEIAAALSLSEQTVKNQLSAGLKVLREELAKALALCLLLFTLF